ncbi:60s ribosomal protein l23 [Phaffia rhodozyma]|uniref:60s ribosomal protein l23 n=1 Tax=Phaffia rhodozyma TaxID=264483 RepID=A0A0F7SEF3_PHARH|nr:60s ribosomal protein l23 [Phaffia rhodozyma]
MSQLIGNPALGSARVWHHVSAENRTLGKLATRIAQVLMGKHKPVFDRGNDVGDYVVVTNCEKLYLSGNKSKQKTYFKQSTFPGRSRHIQYKNVYEKRPEDILAHAVSGMLPKNDHRFSRLARLKVFQGDLNPYQQNILKRYDLSPEGTWSGKGEIPQGPGKASTAFERVKKMERW